jgi:hypothetical protein
MIRVLDQLVLDWGFFKWNYGGESIEQVKVILFNGTTLIMDWEDFISISDEGC